jgi:hypothetical protein
VGYFRSAEIGVFSWLRRRTASARPEAQVVVYSRAGCHLCDEAWQLLEQFQKRYRFGLEKRDVDSEPELKTRHGDFVPVVTVNGKVRFRGRVNPVLLERLFRAGH